MQARHLVVCLFPVITIAVLVCASVTTTGQAAAEAPIDFSTQVWPIFEARCIKCHGPEKQKGDLRLDSREAIARGGEQGGVYVAGKPEDSRLVTLITLPADDPDIMPGSGEPLTPEQVASIRQWIQEGAEFGDWTGAAPDASAPDTTVTPGQTASEPAPESAAASSPVEADILTILAEGLEAPAPEGIAALEASGALIMPIAQDNPLIRVDYSPVSEEVTERHLAALAPLAPNITWLNLAGTTLDDAALAPLASLKNLTALHLEKSKAGDAALLHLTRLEHLQYLNLYRTQVTDKGLVHLQELTNLRRLYLWQTQATPEGAAALQAARPGVVIDLGWQPPAELLTSTESAPAANLAWLFDQEGCCAKAAAGDGACDHPCCVEAMGKGAVCAKCNPGAPARLALAATFKDGGCCAKARAEGRACDHACCVKSFAKGELCSKCNPPS